MSMFEYNVKKVVEELGKRGGLIPVKSLLNSTRFHPFCLVRKKKKKCPWFFETTFFDTYFSLMDILEPSSPVPEVTSSKPFHFYEAEHTDVKGDVALEVTSGLQGEVSGAATSSNSFVLKLQTLTVFPKIWDALMERKVKNPKPCFLQELQNRGEKLYVVAEAVENMEDTILKHSSKKGGSAQMSLGQLLSLPSINLKSKGQGQTETTKLVTINQGCILAYRVLELFIEEDQWRVDYLPDDVTTRRCEEELWIDIATGKTISAPRNFEELKEMMVREQEALTKGPRNLQATLLHAFQKILGDRKALQDLEDMLDQTPDMRDKGQLKAPGADILKYLEDSSRDASDKQTESILYFLGALMTMTDTQQQLLSQSLEKRILPQQLDLVKNILEPNFSVWEESSFSVQPELLSQLTDEDQAITICLVEGCGLNLQNAESQSKWYPKARDPLSALYVALSYLQLLTQD